MYALFMWSTYYPCGGTADLIDSFSTVEGALDYARENYQDQGYDKYEVMDGSFFSVSRGYCNGL